MTAGHQRQPCQVMFPAISMPWYSGRRKPTVPEAKQCAAVLGRKVDLDQRRTGWNIFPTSFPTERVRQPGHGQDLGEFTASDKSILDIDQHQPARARLDSR